MSSLSPPGRNREPLAKSAPSCSASTKRGISCGSVEPSASIITMMSPVAAAKPQARALPLPDRVWFMILAEGRSSRATSTVRSEEPPSTMMTSASAGSAAKTDGRLRSSSRVGTTMEMLAVRVDASGAAGEIGSRWWITGLGRVAMDSGAE